MDRHEFLITLSELTLAPNEAARLLGYDQRTVRRWQERDARVPPAAAAALKAWRNLHRNKLPWRPDAVFLSQLNEEQAGDQIRLYREHTLALDETLKRVKDRGGPASPWKVDLPLNTAELGEMQVHFYRLRAGGFSVASYSRSDKAADIDRDRPLIEDAIACIADAVARETVEQGKVQFVTEAEANRGGLYGTERLLDIDVQSVPGQPGWFSVEGAVSELPENDRESWTTELRPQFGRISWQRMEESIRHKAIKMGIRYVVVKPSSVLAMMRNKA
jgi:hypothetical protein